MGRERVDERDLSSRIRQLRYSQPGRFGVSKLQMGYEGRRYCGHGLLAWDPDSGFTLDARLELTRGDRPTRVSTGGGTFVLPVATLAMEVDRIGRCLARTPHYQSRVNDIWDRPFWQTITFDRARFRRQSGPKSGQACMAAYEYPENAAFLPEIVFSTRKLGEHGTPLEGWQRAGLRAEIDGSEVAGMLEGTTLELQWTLEESGFVSYRRWAAAIETALTAIAARPVLLRRREILLPGRTEEELRGRQHYSPIVANGLIGSGERLDSSEFASLVGCLKAEDVDALVVRKIVWGVMNAFQHRAEAAIDLAIATILEGALRTLEDRNDKQWKVRRGLEWFRVQNRLPNAWKDAHRSVIRSYAMLRMQPAHPYWREGTPAATDPASSLAHRNRLIRYLGLMIRILATMKADPVLPSVPGDAGV